MPSLDSTFYIVRNGEIIENPTNKVNTDVKVPALDKRWCEKINFVRFKRYEVESNTNPSNDITDNSEEYDDRIHFMENDYSYLLRMPHNKFWSQVVYDNSLQQSLDSYLQNVSRKQSDPKLIKLHQLIFLVCLRLSTHKESKDNYFTPDIYGEMIYQHYTFDMPRLYDIVRVYYPCNSEIVTKIVENVFARQPCYQDDLKASLFTICLQLESVKKKLESLQKPASEQMTFEMITTVTGLYDFIEDICTNLSLWLQCYPTSVKSFAEEEFIIATAELYEAVYTMHQSIIVEEPVNLLNFGLDIQKSRSFSHEPLKQLQQFFHQIVNLSCIKPIHLLTIRKTEDPFPFVDSYLEIMTSVLNNQKFLRHYEICHPFHITRTLFDLLDINIDETRLDLIENAFVSSRFIDNTHKPKKSSKVIQSIKPMKHQPQVSTKVMPSFSDTEIESMITSVKELLPHLGNGFVYKCLENYDYSIEQVIDVLLTDCLPDNLKNIDQSLKRTVNEKITRNIDERRNIFDYDEFDVFHRSNVDKSKIHRGKKNMTIAFKDTETIAKLKPLYDLYGNEATEEGGSIYDKTYDGMYNDDYDSDAYVGGDDSSMGIACNAEREDNSDHERDETVIKERMRREPKFSVQKNMSPTRTNRQDFCEDPSLIRERREAARNAKSAPKRTFDVKGSEKGQGQTKDTLHNRAYKEKHKSSNRKAQSNWKRRPQ